MKVGVAVFLMMFATAAAAQEGEIPVFRTNSELVLLDVQVLNSKTGAPRGQLHAADFELSEDGKPQQISFFGRDELPLSVVLLFDLTDSVRGVLPHLAAGAESALSHLKPADEVAVMVYAASARVIDGFTRDRRRTAEAIERASRMKSDEAAFFNEAVYQAAGQLESAPNPSARRVILWLTDNLPNVPTPFNLSEHAKSLGGEMPHTEEEAIRKLHETGTVVMPLLLRDRTAVWAEMILVTESGYRKKHPPGDANKYAEVTGGFSATMRAKAIDERLAQDIDNLRARYTIGYRPAEEKPSGTFCRVKVSLVPTGPVRLQEWRVLARAGYYRK